MFYIIKPLHIYIYLHIHTYSYISYYIIYKNKNKFIRPYLHKIKKLLYTCLPFSIFILYPKKKKKRKNKKTKKQKTFLFVFYLHYVQFYEN